VIFLPQTNAEGGHRRRTIRLRGTLVLAAFCCAVASAAPPKPAAKAPARPAPEPVLRGDAQAGAAKADSERCMECHNPAHRDATASEAHIARLAGQMPEYMLKQLRNFKSGERKHDFMQIMARSLEDEDAADIVAYFASLPPTRGDGSGDAPVPRELTTRGDAARGIAACFSCHGPDGRGALLNGVRAPAIAGQEAGYLDNQLRAFRSGERRNSAGGVMNVAAQKLTDAEIAALANYLAGR
jgi:cytochrome c553